MRKLILSILLAQTLLFAGGNTETTSVPSSYGKTLIAYFTWADNTIVEDESLSLSSALSHYEAMGDRNSHVDAISSASVLQPGNTAQIAEYIKEYTGGETFSIKTEKLYPSTYEECLEEASAEKSEATRPALSTHIENMEKYDTIFLGFPNWWYTAPMAIFSFLEEYDFSGKTIIPFVAHGTGGIAASVRDISRVLPSSAVVLTPLGISRSDMDTAEERVKSWLEELGFAKKENMNTLTLIPADSALSKQLEAMLPLELSFSDFNQTEKIAYLPKGLEINTEDSEAGHEPQTGDLCLYASWGNLCIFYKDFHYSDDLYYLGHIENGLEALIGESEFSAILQ